MRECMDCGVIEADDRMHEHPDYPADRLCDDCALTKYRERRDEAEHDLDQITDQILRNKQ